jgi:ribonucrease Y
MPTVIAIAILIAASAAALWFALRAAARRALARAADRAVLVVQEAESRAQVRIREAEIEAQEIKASAEARFEEQTRRRRQELQQQDEHLKEQERNLGRKLQLLGQKQHELDDRETRVKAREAAVAEREKEAQTLVGERRQKLEKLAGLTAAQARRDLVREVETEARQEAALLVRRIEEEAHIEAAARARRLVAEALQRLPTGDLVDCVVARVKLPSDDMKGRIIGREGRNIRAIEMATGVDLIVDETPETILLSSHDPFRRAVAQTAIERLIEDGRIHPARIEEVVVKARADMEEGLEGIGESAAFDLGIAGLPARLTRLLGKLKYRVVQGYNLLDHSLAVARLAQQMATLLGIPAETVTRAGLLHEIGQVAEGEEAAAHPSLVSADLVAKFGEDPRVVQTIRSLHGTGPDPSVETVLLKTAERAVIARPGERDDDLEAFLERLNQLEVIATSFTGVNRAFAMRSGREVRVIVEAGAVNDSDVVGLSKEITARIQQEVQYPGSVRISVIRETRAVDYAT